MANVHVSHRKEREENDYEKLIRLVAQNVLSNIELLEICAHTTLDCTPKSGKDNFQCAHRPNFFHLVTQIFMVIPVRLPVPQSPFCFAYLYGDSNFQIDLIWLKIGIYPFLGR